MTNVTSTASFRLPLELLEKLSAHAKQSDQTRSQIIRRLLLTYEPVLRQQPEPLPKK
jgi:predicted DNA-binding protein